MHEHYPCHVYDHRSGVWLSIVPVTKRSHAVLLPQLPVNNTLCEVDSSVEFFSGVNTADILANIPNTDI